MDFRPDFQRIPQVIREIHLREESGVEIHLHVTSHTLVRWLAGESGALAVRLVMGSCMTAAPFPGLRVTGIRWVVTEKPTLVLLPGALQSRASLAPLASALAPFADVLPLDLSGHGGQAIPDVLHPREMAAAVVAELDTRNAARAHVFGYSLGGYVGLLLAQAYPERIAGVFAHATKLAWTPEVAAREVRGLDADRMQEKAPAFVAALEQAHTPQDWRLLTRRVAELLTGLGESSEVTDAVLRSLEVPVQLSVGDHDRMVTLEETVGAYRALPQGRLLVLPGVTHPFEITVQERLVSEMRAFLQATAAVHA